MAIVVSSSSFSGYSLETPIRAVGTQREGARCSALCASNQQAAKDSESKAQNGVDRVAGRGQCCTYTSVPGLHEVVTTAHAFGQLTWRQPMQVSWDWQLESTILFKAVGYLDQYLSQHTVDVLSRSVCPVRGILQEPLQLY